MAQRRQYVIDCGYDGRRVYDYLRQAQGCSNRLITALKHLPDGMMLEGERVRTIDRIHTGQHLVITLPAGTGPQLAPSRLQVPVVYEDADVIVYDKPAGMNCHPTRRVQTDTLANVFAAHCAANGSDSTFRCLTRLDKDTSGLVLLAKDQQTADRMKQACQKRYLALVQGVPEQPEGTVDAPIARINAQYTQRQVHQDGQRAVTHYRTVAQGRDHSLVELWLKTGRTHQIRVHMAWLGHPLAGDDMYGGSLSLIGRQALHCSEMCFVSPATGQTVKLHAPVPEDIQKALMDARIYV